MRNTLHLAFYKNHLSQKSDIVTVATVHQAAPLSLSSQLSITNHYYGNIFSQMKIDAPMAMELVELMLQG